MPIHVVAFMKRMTRLLFTNVAVRLRRGFGVAVALGCLYTAQVSDAAAPAALPLTECRLQSPNVGGSVAARCGSLDVLEDRSNSSSKRVSVHVAVIPALRTEAQSDPLFIVSGGPGQA